MHRTTEETLGNARKSSYGLLASGFYDPGHGSSEVFDEAQGVIPAMEALSPEAAQWARTMVRERQRCDLQELAVEHARLFVGPFELQAPPYGSVYLERGRRVMGDSTMAALAWYREFGLSMSESLKDLPDHIAVELEFMYHLAHRQVEAIREGDEGGCRRYMKAQAEFLEGQLRPWIPQFCGAITSASGHPFFQALARCLELFTGADADYLRSSLRALPPHGGRQGDAAAGSMAGAPGT